MAISAAVAGLGVALVLELYIEKELKEQSLVTPWPKSKALYKKFCLVKPVETGENDIALMAFEKWLCAEMEK